MKDKILTIRITQEMHKTLQDKKKKSFVNVAEYVRQIISDRLHYEETKGKKK